MQLLLPTEGVVLLTVGIFTKTLPLESPPDEPLGPSLYYTIFLSISTLALPA